MNEIAAGARNHPHWTYFVAMKRTAFALLLLLVALGTASARAQVVPSAEGSRLSVTAGGLASAFQPDYAGGGVPATAPNRLYGIGAYVDVKVSQWVQFEAEGRWMRFNPYVQITEDNYLIGPRLPIHRLHFWRATPYAKALIGFGDMSFEYNEAHGRFTDIAFGGGLDVKVTRRISVRAADFEFQDWPSWVNNHGLSPYGLSVGVGYKIF